MINDEYPEFTDGSFDKKQNGVGISVFKCSKISFFDQINLGVYFLHQQATVIMFITQPLITKIISGTHFLMYMYLVAAT